MCLVLAIVFTVLTYSFFEDGNLLAATISGVIALFFIGLLTRNILKTKKERQKDLKD